MRHPDYVPQDLVPALSHVPLNKLSDAQIAAFISAQVAPGPRPYRRLARHGAP